MKFFFNPLFLFLPFLILEAKAFALTDSQIRQICYKKLRDFNCIRNLKDKRTNLIKGNRIKIPVIPHKER